MGGNGDMGVGDSDFNYGRMLKEAFLAGEPFVLIEQDIILHELVMPEFEECREPWCSFPYGAGEGSKLTESLGCIWYSAELLAAITKDAPYLGITPWWGCDGVVARIIHDAGFRVHTHYPQVGHAHNHIAGTFDDTRTETDFRRKYRPEELIFPSIRTEKVDPLAAIRTDMGGMRYITLHGVWEQRFDQRWQPLRTPCPDCIDMDKPGPQFHAKECPRVNTEFQFPDEYGIWAPLPAELTSKGV
jgi:hypothetical protein